MVNWSVYNDLLWSAAEPIVKQPTLFVLFSFLLLLLLLVFVFFFPLDFASFLFFDLLGLRSVIA